MARFNSKNSNKNPLFVKKSLRKDIVLNAENAISFSRTFKEDITTIISNAVLSGKDNFYESDNERMDRIESVVASLSNSNITPEYEDAIEFLAKAIVYSRTVANIRSLPTFLTVILSEYVKNNGIVRKVVRNAISRPDDMTELVSLWDLRNPKSETSSENVPSSIRRGLKDVLESDKFNAFGYKRYFGSNKVKMSDIVKIARPYPKNDEQSKLFKQIIEGSLDRIETVESMRSDETSSKDVIVKLLKDKKLGYMAAIKNIVNFIKDNPTDEEFNMFVEYLGNENAIKNSKLFPFRIWDAWKMIEQTTYISDFKIKQLRNVLDKALSVLIQETKMFDENERVAIILDESGSMSTSSFNSSFYEIGLLLSAIILSKADENNTLFYTFADECRKRNTTISSILDFVNNAGSIQGGGTYFEKVFEKLLASETVVDKIVIFTDMQLYSIKGFNYYWVSDATLYEFYNKYLKINPNVKIIFWNLNSYQGGTPLSLKENGVCEINGFSANIINSFPKLLKDKNYILNEIEKIKLV